MGALVRACACQLAFLCPLTGIPKPDIPPSKFESGSIFASPSAVGPSRLRAFAPYDNQMIKS